MAASSQPLFIFLQETHATSENDLDHLKNHLRKYIWFHDSFSERKHGLVIGIRCVEGLRDPSPFCFEKNEGGLFGLKVFIQNQEFSALNVYHHPGLKLEHLMEESSWFFSPQSKNILAGDLNWDLNETNCQKLIEHLSDLNLSCLNWSEPTHFQGQCINHIFLPSEAPKDHLFVNAIPSGFKDHAVMIGGVSVKEWKINSWKKRIPEYLINDPKFISALSEAVGNYSVGDPMTCLDKIKSEAWRLTALWKDKHKEVHLFKKLWKLQTLVKKLRTTWILRKDSPAQPFTSLEAELREAAAENWDNPLKGRKWRLKIIPWMIKVGLSWIASLEQQLGVFLDNPPSSA